jgi:PPM family protein phosphatase
VLRAFGFSDRGSVRPANEDRFAIAEDLGLCVVADGMGGHNAGEVASQLAVDAIVDVVRHGPDGWMFGYDPLLSDDGNLLRTAVHVASLQVAEAAAASEEYAGMGTTIVAARVIGQRLVVAHAGDSRLYLLREGRLSQVTTDDSWIAGLLAENPDLDAAALQHHPMRNALTNVVGGTARTDVHVTERTLGGRERLLLSTDGVHTVVDHRRLEQMLLSEDQPRMIACRMIRAALALGSADDCTAVVAQYVAA